MSRDKKTARLAGLLFLIMVVSGLFAEVFFRQKLFVPDNIVMTAKNILSNVFLYRAGIMSDILMALSYLLTALALYRLLAPVSKQIAATMVVFAAAGSVLLLFSCLFEVAPLLILPENDYLAAFSTSQLQSLAMLFYNLYGHGYMIGQIFFALWVLPLGVLIYRSKFIPRAFGVLFVVEAILGLASVLVHFLAPSGTLETVLLLPGIVAEFSFMFWLLIRGVSESTERQG